MKPPTQEQMNKIAKDSTINQQIQLLLYRWRDRGCPYDSDMINMIYEIMEIVRK